MKKAILAGAAVLLAAGTVGAFAGAKVDQTYLRKGTQEIRVFTSKGKLYCRRTSDNFELCYGMEKQADGSWKGKHMRHPDMPKFMIFNGTVIIGSNDKLSIKGCAVGNSLCDSEIWDLKK